MTLTIDFHAHQVLEGVFITYDLGRDSEIMGGGELRSNFRGPYKFQYSYGGVGSQEFWCFSQEVI